MAWLWIGLKQAMERREGDSMPLLFPIACAQPYLVFTTRTLNSRVFSILGVGNPSEGWTTRWVKSAKWRNCSHNRRVYKVSELASYAITFYLCHKRSFRHYWTLSLSHRKIWIKFKSFSKARIFRFLVLKSITQICHD